MQIALETWGHSSFGSSDTARTDAACLKQLV